MMEIEDGRRLSEIAAELEDCAEIRARKGEKDTEPITLYEGYTELTSIYRERDAVRITLEKPKEG